MIPVYSHRYLPAGRGGYGHPVLSMYQVVIGACHAVVVTDVDLARRVRDRCRLTGRFVLRSGRVADEYFDKYQFEADPAL
jgi:hypothetical protein